MSTRRPKQSKCFVTGKRAFNSHDAALVRGGEILARPNRKATTFRAYRCDYCGLWHLTTKYARQRP